MSDVRELYQQLILDHGRKPRNFGSLDSATHIRHGVNPLCGDHLVLYVEIKDEVISSIKFDGDGCAISLASASLMTEALLGLSVQAAQKLFNDFHNLVAGDNNMVSSLGKLEVLGGVSAYPARVKCATLAWQTLNSALTNDSGEVTTE